MSIDDIGQVVETPDYDPNESVNSGSTGAVSGTTSNIAGYDVTNEPLAPNLILNRNQTSVGIYTPILTPVSNGYQLSWTNNAGLPNPNAVIISNGTNGTDGENGTDGADGVTYTPHVAAIENGFQITFTNDGGRPNPSPVEIHNGAEGPQGPEGPQGETGPAGADGEDGFSPVATVTKSGTVITITITDANGTTTQSFDTATGGGVPIDYMSYDWDEEIYTGKEVTGIELYNEGSEVENQNYAKMHVTYKDGEDTNDMDILIGRPIMFTTVTQSGIVSLPITGVYKSGNQFSITLGDDAETIYLNSVPDSGTTGYVLTKTASGYEWQAPQGGGGGGITPTVIIGGQSYPATALQYDPSANAFSVQAEGAWYGYVVPSLKIYEASEQGFMPLKDIQINLDTGIIFMNDTNGNIFSYDLLPSGGSYGQILSKDVNGHPVWVTPGNYVPSNGTAGQVLKKYGAGATDYAWDNIPNAGASILVNTPLFLDASASSSSRVYEASQGFSISNGDLLLVDVNVNAALSTAGLVSIQADIYEGATRYGIGSHNVYYPVTSFDCHLTFVFLAYANATIDKLRISLGTNDGAFTTSYGTTSIKVVKL